MSWTLKIVLVLVACLVTCASAGDDEEATNGLTRTVITVPVVNQTLGTEEKLVTIGQADLTALAVVKAVIYTGLILGVLLLFSVLIFGISTRLYPEKELEHLEYYDDHKYYGSQRHPRSVVDDVSFLTQVFKSIDTVESALDTMKVDHLACRELAVCHLQRIASKLPSLGLLLQVISPSISGMEKYREAQEAGAALEDCTLLYSECPTSLARFLKGDHTG
ncbi:uncharacterized protein LOC121853889 isoform X1 [Homarus americanus]|uniref:uncharacterized protein LOC121853889 isoform X1 n=1 Tax=Homarus americanus TaxID=6706 RepID=UPI001C454E0F|nr:uncharacterized protein LOC121853889 isoform X1 [Homarus americanus]